MNKNFRLPGWALTTLAVALLVWPYTSRAQVGLMCAPRAQVLEGLKKGYDEHPVSLGLARNGTIVEVLVSETGSWTIIATAPGGLSCPLAIGEGWQAIDEAPIEDDGPAI